MKHTKRIKELVLKEYDKTKNISKISRDFKISRPTIREWIKEELNII